MIFIPSSAPQNPQVEVTWAQGKQGRAPPLRVKKAKCLGIYWALTCTWKSATVFPLQEDVFKLVCKGRGALTQAINISIVWCFFWNGGLKMWILRAKGGLRKWGGNEVMCARPNTQFWRFHQNSAPRHNVPLIIKRTTSLKWVTHILRAACTTSYFIPKWKRETGNQRYSQFISRLVKNLSYTSTKKTGKPSSSIF